MSRAGSPGGARWRGAAICAVALVMVACGSTNPIPSVPSGGSGPLPADVTSAPATISTSATPTTSTAPPPSDVATTSPSPSDVPSPSASPGPSAADVSAAFLATVHAATFVARTTVAGQLVVGTAQYAVSGTDDVSGASVHATITIATPGGQPDETIVVDHRVYHRTGTSPWFRAATSGATDLGALLRALLLVTDMGVESHHDRLLHHLVLPAGTSLAPALLGVAGVGRTGLVAGVEFWATDEGAIAAMVVTATWKQTSGGALVDGSTTVEYTFADPATAVAIPAPTDIWTTYKSKVSHMTFSYPVDLTVVTGSKLYPVDGVVATSVRTLSVEIGRFPSDGLTIDQVVHRFLSDPYNKTGFHLDSETKVEMAGVSGRQVLIHMTQAHELHVDTPAYRAKKRHWIYTEIVKGAWVYEVFIASDAGYEAEDLTLLHDIVASVVIT